MICHTVQLPHGIEGSSEFRVYLSPPLNHSSRRPYMWVFSIPRYQIQAVWRGFSTFFCQRSKRQIICQQHFWGFYICLSHLNRYFCWTSIYSSIYTYIDIFVDICICRVCGVAKPSAANPFLKDSEDMWWLAWYGGCTWIIQQLSHFDAPVTSIECFIIQPSPGIMIPTFAFLFLGIDWHIYMGWLNHQAVHYGFIRCHREFHFKNQSSTLQRNQFPIKMALIYIDFSVCLILGY